MKRLRDIIESNYMYHATIRHVENRLQADRGDYMIDRAVGAHFAADPAVSQKFQKGLTSTGKTQANSVGTMFRALAPTRAELTRVPQKKYKHGAIQSDQYAIANHVVADVFTNHPEGRDMFKSFMANRFNNSISDEHAGQIYDHLKAGRAPIGIGTPWDDQLKRSKSIGRFMDNWGYQGSPEEKKDLVTKFVDLEKSRGKKGMVYRNTSPNETRNQNGQRDIRSDKSYIIYDPEHIPLETHRISVNRGK